MSRRVRVTQHPPIHRSCCGFYPLDEALFLKKLSYFLIAVYFFLALTNFFFLGCFCFLFFLDFIIYIFFGFFIFSFSLRVFSFFPCVLWFSVWSKKRIWNNIVTHYKALVSLVSNKITMQSGGMFGTTKLATKTQQRLGASQVSFYL
jgi:hypothetical protein